jgi:hypothetical protein
MVQTTMPLQALSYNIKGLSNTLTESSYFTAMAALGLMCIQFEKMQH